MQQHIVLLLSFTLLSCLAGNATAQDKHYWSQQFGSRAALMSGAVIAGARDTSASFYNPGALGFIESETFSVSANAYQIQSVDIPNGAGNDMDLESTKINLIPSIISGSFGIEQLPKDRFVYSLLARNQSSYSVSARQEAELEARTSFPGDETVVSQYLGGGELSEIWGGLSWARKLNQNFSIGVTGYLASRNHQGNESERVIAVNDEAASTYTSAFSTDYSNFRSLIKIGLAAEFSQFKLGLTLTSPSVSLGGKATVAGDVSATNLDSEDDQGNATGEFFSIVATDRQEKLDTTYKTPLSIALGVEYAASAKTIVALGVEWFSEQNAYSVFEPASKDFVLDAPDEFSGSAYDTSNLLGLEEGARSVVNFGIGLQHALSDKLTGYVSFNSDRSYASENFGLGIADWDIKHFTLGGSYKSERSEIAIGFTLSNGSKNDYKSDAIHPQAALSLFEGDSQTTTTSADYSSASLIVGYTYFLK